MPKIIIMSKTLQLKSILKINIDNDVEIMIEGNDMKNKKRKNKKKVETDKNKIKLSRKSKKEKYQYFATSKYFIAPPVSAMPIPQFD